MSNPLGETSLQVRDGLGRPVRAITPLGEASTTAYDTVVAGLVETAASDPLGNTVRSRSDGLGRERQRMDALGNVARSVGYDAGGNAVSVRDAASVGRDCVFDGLGRDVSCLDTRGFTTTRTYNAHGQVETATDADSKIISTTWDARGRRVTTTDRLGALSLTSFTYDAAGNLQSITDAEGGRTEYTYDSRGLLTQELFPKGQATGAADTAATNTNARDFFYDTGRRLIARHDQAGVVTTYGYDNAQRLLTRGYPGAIDVFTYDQAGRLTYAANGLSQARLDSTMKATAPMDGVKPGVARGAASAGARRPSPRAA